MYVVCEIIGSLHVVHVFQSVSLAHVHRYVTMCTCTLAVQCVDTLDLN